MSRKIVFFILLCACGLLFQGCNRLEKAQVKKMKVGEVELAYYLRGKGEPLIMIMGFRGTMGIWDPSLLEELEKKYTLILFDNRGAGLSSDTEQDKTTIAQMAEDTAELIQALGYKKAHVLGWSMGSRIAMELALKFPELVESLILCSPNPGGKSQAKRTTDAYKALTSPSPLSVKEGLSLIFPNTPEGDKASEAFLARLTKAIIEGTVPDDRNVSLETVKRQVHALQLWDRDDQLYELLPRIKISTLVAGGLNDALDNPENVQTVACRIPFAWSAYFPGAGHYFLSQNHRKFAELAILFTVQWLHSQGCPWNLTTCQFAARGGHLEVLKWARGQKCPWDETTCNNAARSGRLDVLQWARGKGCPWNADTCRFAAEHGHLHVLEWARANGCPWNKKTWTFATSEVRWWLRKNKFPWIEPDYWNG